MEEIKEKNGILKRVAPSTGGLVFEDEPETWYNATKTAAQYVKADLKGKKVKIRLADKPNTFSFISICADQPEKAPEEQGVKSEAKPSMSKDDYWSRKETRDILKDEQISRHGSINTSLEAIKCSMGSNPTNLSPDEFMDIAIKLAESKVLPFVKGIAKNKD